MKIRFGVCGVLLAAAACRSPSATEGGVETGPCVDYQCFAGLVCLSNLCVDPGDGSSGPSDPTTVPGDGDPEPEPGASTSVGAETADGSTGDVAIEVTIFPSDPTVATTTHTQFTAAVTGAEDTAVTWSLADDVGEVSPGGEYSAPLLPGVVQLRATSVADPTVVATTTITIEDRAGKPDQGFLGTIINVGTEMAAEAVLDEDGSIIVVGSHAGFIVPWNMAVVRVLPNGGIDVTFGENGLLRVGPPQDGAFGNSLLRRDAEVLLGGGSDGMMLASATTAGELVPGFGAAGIEYVPGGGDAAAIALAAVPPDRFVAGGLEQIFLFESDGTAVPSFAGDGIANAMIPAAWASYWPYSDAYRVIDLLVQPDGRILVLGMSPPDNYYGGAMVISRLTEAGQLDATFGTGGVELYAKDALAAMLPEEMLLLDDGRIMVAGQHDDRFFVTRVLADGTLDRSFGENGWTQHVYDRNLAFEVMTNANAIERLPDGSFVVLCSIGGLVGVLRMSAEGAVDFSFGDDSADGWGLVETGFDSLTLSAVDLLFQPPGRLIAVVDAYDPYESFAVFAFHAY